jgi:multiple sugar transport system substrate-binding protein
MTRYAGATTSIHNYPGQGILGLPLCVYPTVDFYNKDIFDAAGVEYPPHQWGAAYADGAKWDLNKLVEVAKKITLDANGNDANSPAFDTKNIKQFGWDGWDWGNNIEWAMFFGDEPGTGVTVDGKKSNLATKQFVDAVTFLKDAVWTTHIRANGEQAGAFYANAGDPMGSGMVGIWEVNSWMSYAWSGWSEKFKWDIAAVPEGPNGKIISITDADTSVVSGTTKHPKEAWEVMKWLFEQPQYDKLIANYGCIPADTKSLAGWKGVQEGKFPGVDFQVILDGMGYLEKVNHESWKPHYTEVNTEMGKVQSTILAGTNLDVQAVLKEADTAVQTLLDQYWSANQ